MRDTDNSSAPVTVEALSHAVTQLVDDVYQSLDAIGIALTTRWEDISRRRMPPPRTSDLAELRDTIVAELDRRGSLFNSAGVVMADGALADRARHLEWWQPGDQRGPRRHIVDLNPRSEYFYDYTAMDWFAIPRDRGQRWVHGPYLDYTGADLYICTFAQPVKTSSGTFLGIAGADVPAAAIEESLLPRFRASGRRVVLINGEGRVIMGTDPEFTPGSKASRIRSSTPAVPIATTPWSLLELGSIEAG